MNMQALALAFLSAVTVGGLAWVFIYPLLSGEKQAEKRRAPFTAATPALPCAAALPTTGCVCAADRSKTSMKELERRLAETRKVSLEGRIAQAGLNWTKQQFLIGSGVIAAVVFAAVFFVGEIGPLPAIGFAGAAGFGVAALGAELPQETP